MIDFDDAEMVGLAVPGLFGVVAFVILLVIAFGNEEECSKKSCDNKAKPELLDGKCLCVKEAK